MNFQVIFDSGSFLSVLAGTTAAFSLWGVLIATTVVAAVGLFIGLFLGFAAKTFEVKTDEREVLVRELLPGANCGGCGYPGCDGMAAAIVKGEAPVSGCPVANSESHKKIAEVMGATVQEEEKKVAFVKCSGTCDKTKVKYEYYGVKDCKKVALVPGKGNKSCNFGCMGFGSCVKACAFDAIHVVNGIAVVDKEKCKGCSSCVAACPNHLIDMVPVPAKHLVACNSTEKGKNVKEACDVGCIGCRLCTKACEMDAIQVENNLAFIDYSKCTNCGKCAAVCPVKVIRNDF